MQGETGSVIKDLKGYLEPKQVRVLKEAAPTARDKLLIEVLWVTGARISEVVDMLHGIRPCDFVEDKRGSAIIMRTLKRGTKKNPKAPPSRQVVIPRRVLNSLKEYSKDTPSDQRIFPISRQRAFQLIRRVGRLAGITKVGDKGLHPHHLRHSHAIAYVKHDDTLEGLKKLQRRMGHSSFATTAHYLQFSMKGEAKKVEDIFREGKGS